MEREKDLEYSEIMELATILPNGIPEPPSQSPTSETQFGTYINVASLLGPRSDLGTDTRASNKPQSVTATDTFKRYSSIEETDVVQYDNLPPIAPGRDMSVSTDKIVPISQEASNDDNNGGQDGQEDALSLKTRLRIKKQRFKFLKFAGYAMVAVYKEVESIIGFDVFFFIFSVLLTSLGFSRLSSCKMSPRMPVMMVVSGILDGFVAITSIVASSVYRWQECLKDVSRAGRLVMFFMHIYCLLLVYWVLPPEEKDPNSPNYCDAFTFWASFSYFHIIFVTSIFTWIGMLAAAASYFL